MAQKSGSKELVKFIPSMERDDERPTTVCFLPLSKREYDAYIGDLAEIRGRKIISKTKDAFEILCKRTLKADTAGVYIYNIYDGDIFVETISDKDKAVNLLVNMQSIECANEIENAMRSQSTLDEEEAKN